MQMEKIFSQIAKERGITVREVREEMQKAINEAWAHPQRNSVTAAYQRQIPCKGEIPTPEEFIDYVASRIQAQTNDGQHSGEVQRKSSPLN